MSKQLVWIMTLAALVTPTFARAADAPAPEMNPIVERVDFREVAIGDALRLLSAQTGMNIVASSEASKVKISLFLQNVGAQAVVDEICRANGLWYRRDPDSHVTRVVTLKEFQQDLTSFREQRTQVFTLLYPNAIQAALAIRDLYGDRVQFTIGQEDLRDESRDLRERFNRFDIIDQRSQGLGLTDTTGSSYNNSNFARYGSNSSIYDNSSADSRYGLYSRSSRRGMSDDGYADQRNLTPDQAAAISRQMERNPQENPAQAAGVYRSTPASIFVTVLRRNNMLVVRTSDDKTMEEIGTLIKKLDVPTPLVLLEVKVLGIELGNGFDSAFEYQFSDGSTSAGGFSSGNIQPPVSDLLSGTARRGASVAPGGSGIDTNSLVFQYVNNSFRARLQLLESENRVTQLATPLILTANNEVSRLFVGEERPIVRNISSQTIINNNNTTTTPTTQIDFRPVGNTLLITPSINADRTVTLRVLQENSSINAGGASIPIVSTNGNVTDQPVDVVSSRTVSGTVVAKDRLAVAIGGLIEEEVSDVQSKVPLLGDLPLAGILFRRQETKRSKRELIVVIRPYVVNTPAEAQAISEELLKNLSSHPKATDLGGDMGVYKQSEVLQPDDKTLPGKKD